MSQEVSFRGQTIGMCGSEFLLPLPGVTGLGVPDVKMGTEVDRLGTHGSTSGADYLGSRVIGIPVMIHHRDDVDAAMSSLRKLRAMWRPALSDELLSVTIPGYGPADNTMRFWGRPRGSLSVDLALLHTGTVSAYASFSALDPIGYGPLTTVSLSSGANNIVVTGDAPSSRATIELTGNGGTPTIINTTHASRQVIFQAPIPSGQVWTLDLHRQTLRNASGTDMFSAIAPTSSWFHLLGGANSISLSGVASGSMTYRGGWW